MTIECDKTTGPIHSHSSGGILGGTVVSVKDGMYSSHELVRVVACGPFSQMSRDERARATDLEKELAGVICEYLEGRRES